MAQYKINIQISVIFLYTSNEQLQNEIKKTHSIYNVIQKNKVLRNKFNKKDTRLRHWKLQNIIEKPMARHWSKFIKSNCMQSKNIDILGMWLSDDLIWSKTTV